VQFPVGQTIMEVNPSRIESVDEAWILKFRAALENVPAEERRFAKTLDALRAFRAKVMTHMSQVLLSMRKPKLVAATKSVAAPISLPVRESEQELKAS
jgi:hypothetical protein